MLQGKLRREWLVEYEGKEDALETDANTFAREFLIPSEEIRKVREKHGGKMPLSAGHELAKKVGISGGIVAGRLQFDRIWVRFVGNEMKRRYQISDLVSGGVSS